MYKSHLSNANSNMPIYCLILVIMVMVGRIQEVIPGFSALHLGKVSFILSFGLYILFPDNSHSKLFDSPQSRFLTTFLCLGLLSAPFSLWVGKSIKFMLLEFGTLLLMVLLLKAFVTTYEKLLQIIWGTLISVAILGLTALIFTKIGRVAASGTYDPNDLALVLVSLLPIAYYLMQTEKGVKKITLIGVICLFILTIMATQSRGGWLGLMLVIVITLISVRIKIGSLVTYSFILVFLIYFFTPEGYWDRISTIFTPSEDYNISSSAGRIAIWKRGLNEAFDHPILGVGPAVFAVAEGLSHEEEGGKWSPPHNSFIQVLTEFGIPGFIVYLAILISAVRSLRRFYSSHIGQNIGLIAKGSEIGIYGFAVCGFFLSQAFSSVLFLLIGFSIAIPNIDLIDIHCSGSEQGEPLQSATWLNR